MIFSKRASLRAEGSSGSRNPGLAGVKMSCISGSMQVPCALAIPS